MLISKSVLQQYSHNCANVIGRMVCILQHWYLGNGDFSFCRQHICVLWLKTYDNLGYILGVGEIFWIITTSNKIDFEYWNLLRPVLVITNNFISYLECSYNCIAFARIVSFFLRRRLSLLDVVTDAEKYHHAYAMCCCGCGVQTVNYPYVSLCICTLC